MFGDITTFWGKLERDGEAGVVRDWHPLLAHCADVAACAEALLEQTILGQRLAALGGRATWTAIDVARLAALAALHDLGKFNLGFQRKGDAQPHHTAGHVAEVLALIGSGYPEETELVTALPAELRTWCDGDITELLVAAIGHHGRPVLAGPAGGTSIDRSLWKAGSSLSPFAGIASLSASLRRWFPAAFAASTVPLPDAPRFQHGFAGLIMLADWLGSDRALFPFADDLDDRMPMARNAARKALCQVGLDVHAARATLGPELPGFQHISAFCPNEAQRTTLALERPAQGSLAILESETGSGKTEAALGRYVQLFQAGLVDGMVFALPTRTAATHLHQRVVDAVERAFPDALSRPPVVLAVPGYLQVDDRHGRRLPGFEVLWNDDPHQRARHRGWAAETPKRYLAGAVVVGTVDQVLLSSLRVGHAHLRATALFRHLLVIDEVHASDAYMNRILEEVLAFHLAAKGHALLMSATLGSAVRHRLERAALDWQGSATTLQAALATPYPVVHHAARGEPPRMHPVVTPGLAKTVQVTLESLADMPTTIAEKALDAARAGARVLVLRNTVRDAVATHVALEAIAQTEDAPLLLHVGNVITLHHARFSKPDREQLDRAIQGRFGKHAPARGGVVAVTTQTVQQSLDLDADLMFTDLAPMDVLLQRLGRVHRHPDTRDPDRPEGFRQPRTIVMTADAPLEQSLRKDGEARGTHGVGTVYDDVLILEATRQRLARDGRLVIPAQNRELVEVTTHPEALDALAQRLGEAWQKHRSKVNGVTQARSGLARLNLVERNERFGSYAFQRTELDERIATRLGESDRRALFAEPPDGPFGSQVRELTLPGWWTRQAPPDPDLAPSQIQQGPGLHGPCVRFAFGPLRFAYDRLGLRRDDDLTFDPASIDPSEEIADA